MFLGTPPTQLIVLVPDVFTGKALAAPGPGHFLDFLQGNTPPSSNSLHRALLTPIPRFDGVRHSFPFMAFGAAPAEFGVAVLIALRQAKSSSFLGDGLHLGQSQLFHLFLYSIMLAARQA
jgi:hypothetical protein